MSDPKASAFEVHEQEALDKARSILSESESPIGKDMIDFRLSKQTLGFNFDHDCPAWAKGN